MTRERIGRLANQALLIALGAVLMSSALRFAHLQPQPFYDFDLYYFGAIAERHGSYVDLSVVQELARAHHRPVPPDGVYGTASLVALVFVPLTFLPLAHAHTLWNVITVFALIAGIRTAVGTNRWVYWALLLATSHSLLAMLSLGNASVLTFALTAYAFGALRDRRPRATGISLGLAIAAKAYPAFLLLALVGRRQWRTVIAALVAVAAASVVTLPLLDLDGLFPSARETLRVAGHIHPSQDNASIPGLVASITGAQMPARIVGWVLMAAGALVVLRRRHEPVHVTFAISVLAMLLAQGIAWRHYFPLTIVALLALRDLPMTRLRWCIAGAGFVLSNGYATFVLGDHRGDHRPSTLIATGTLVLMVSVVFAAREHRFGSRVARGEAAVGAYGRERELDGQPHEHTVAQHDQGGADV